MLQFRVLCRGKAHLENLTRYFLIKTQVPTYLVKISNKIKKWYFIKFWMVGYNLTVS